MMSGTTEMIVVRSVMVSEQLPHVTQRFSAVLREPVALNTAACHNSLLVMSFYSGITSVQSCAEL